MAGRVLDITAILLDPGNTIQYFTSGCFSQPFDEDILFTRSLGQKGKYVFLLDNLIKSREILTVQKYFVSF